MTTTTPTATVTAAYLAELERLAQDVLGDEGPLYYAENDGAFNYSVYYFDRSEFCLYCTREVAALIAAACNAALPLVAQLRAEQAARKAAEAELDELKAYAQKNALETAEAMSRQTERLIQLEGIERERDEARQRAAAFPLCDCGCALDAHDANGCPDHIHCIGYTHGVKDLCFESPLETQLRERAERAEADAVELRALLAKRAEVYGYQWYVWDLDEARALLARTGAERKDGGERVA